MGESKERNLHDGMALCVYLSERLSFSNRITKTLIKKGLVKVNNKVITATRHPVYSDDIIKLRDDIV